MRYRIRIIPEAGKEIAVIKKALTPYPRMGARIFSEIDRKLNGLKDNPFAYQVFSPRPKYRRINVEGHVIFYTVDEDKHGVAVCHIYYAKRELARLLKD